MSTYKLNVKKEKKHSEEKKITGTKVFNFVNVAIMCILLLVVFYPFWYAVIYSFSSAQEASKGLLKFWPSDPTLVNYKTFLDDNQIYISFLVTFLRTIVGTVTSVLFTAMVAYGLSKSYLIGRKIYITLGIITMVFSAGMIPSYFVIQKLHLINTFWVYIIPALFSFYNALIFMTFFRGLPPSLEESAKIDGANDMKIFTKIIIPLSMPVIATIALFNGVGAYNDYFTTILYISGEHKHLYTIQYYLYQIINQTQVQAIAKNMPAEMQRQLASKTSPTSLKYAAMLLTTVPIMCVYPFLQKYFVKGVMIGSVKG